MKLKIYEPVKEFRQNAYTISSIKKSGNSKIIEDFSIKDNYINTYIEKLSKRAKDSKMYMTFKMPTLK